MAEAESKIISLFPDPVGDMLRKIHLLDDSETRLVFELALYDSLGFKGKRRLARAEE